MDVLSIASRQDISDGFLGFFDLGTVDFRDLVKDFLYLHGSVLLLPNQFVG
jgi:hypothetical protein